MDDMISMHISLYRCSPKLPQWWKNCRSHCNFTRKCQKLKNSLLLRELEIQKSQNICQKKRKATKEITSHRYTIYLVKCHTFSSSPPWIVATPYYVNKCHRVVPAVWLIDTAAYNQVNTVFNVSSSQPQIARWFNVCIP